MFIEVNNLSITYKQNQETFQALSHISLQIEKGEFICLLGPSGCGKSTLLSAIAGFTHPSKGTISIDGKIVEKPFTQYLTIFQNYGLLPWRTVLKNVEFGLEMKKVPKDERMEIARHYIHLVGLGGVENKRLYQLSGGM